MSTSPGPWKWEDYDGSTGGRGGDLIGPDGVPVIATIPTGPNSARIEAATRLDAALIASAPEMLALLRELEWAGNESVGTCPVCGCQSRDGHGNDQFVPTMMREACRLGALLDRLGRDG